MTTSTRSSLSEESSSVQTHLGILQAVIQRMSENSASCKGWCVAITSAVLVVVADKDKSAYSLIALIPTLVFLLLDTHYLSLERGFRRSYNDFIDKLHGNRIVPSDLYAVAPSGGGLKRYIGAMASFTIWPFYVMLLAMIIAAWRLVF